MARRVYISHHGELIPWPTGYLPTSMEYRLRYLVILLGITAASFAAIFIRIADEAPALIIASYRLLIATAIMTPYAIPRIRRQQQHYSKSTFRWNLVSGLFLALHFATWIASLKYTSVARSVILVSINPIFVALLGWMFLRERVKPLTIAGMLLSLLGIAVMSIGELQVGRGDLTGDVLALAGALFAAAYFIIGRNLRQTISTSVYSYVTYGIAALVLAVLAFASGAAWIGYTSTTYLMFLLLAVVPQIIGHTSFNYALRYVPAVIVALAILGEPILSSTFAWVLLGEGIQISTFYGGGFVLIGVFLAVYTQEKN